MCRALSLLWQARAYAFDVGHDVWTFAVESASLRQFGLTTTDLRWLTCKGYVEHAREVTTSKDDRRTFQPESPLRISKRSCFILTDLGAERAPSLLNRHSAAFQPESAEGPGACSSPRDSVSAVAPPGSTDRAKHERQRIVNGAVAPREIPRWDCDYREIRYRGRLVKQFKLPSPNQEAVLMAFEEEGWPPKIDDPLPPHPDCDPKQRLHDTIRSLNRNQKDRLLHFKGDGTGEGVLWEVFSGAPSGACPEGQQAPPAGNAAG